MASLTVNGNNFDLSSGSSDATKSNYILVGFKAALTSENKQKLKEHDVELQEYVGDNTYLCRYMPMRDLGSVKTLDFVLHAALYAPSLAINAGSKAAILSAADNKGISEPISVILHQNVDGGVQKVLDDIKTRSKGSQVLETTANEIRLRVPVADIDKVAAIDGVKAMESVPKVVYALNLARETTKVEALQQHYYYKGEGQVVAFADSGLDVGVDDSKKADPTLHESFRGRIVGFANYNGDGDPFRDVDGHGTAVAGCIVGNPLPPPKGKGVSDAQKAQGVACKARVLSITYDSDKEIKPELRKLFCQTYQDGNETKVPPIHSNSWSTQKSRTDLPQNVYATNSSGEVDAAMWENPNLLILFGAGNNGLYWCETGCQIEGPMAAKNCVTVGALTQMRPFGQNDGVMNPDLDKPEARAKWSAYNVVGFSNRGPTQENRVKPDLVAPGTGVLTTQSSCIKPGQANRGYETYNLDDGTEDKRFCYVSGTSFAAPQVAGAAACLREAYVKEFPGVLPRGALLKALLINGATDLAGSQQQTSGKMDRGKVPAITLPIGPAPNGIQGFGLMNLEDSMLPIFATDPTQGGLVNTQTLNIDGANKIWKKEWITDAKASSNISVTLTWTDPSAVAMQQFFSLKMVCTDSSKKSTQRLCDAPEDWVGSNPALRENNVQRIVWKDVAPKTAVAISVECIRAHAAAVSADFSLVWAVKKS